MNIASKRGITRIISLTALSASFVPVTMSAVGCSTAEEGGNSADESSTVSERTRPLEVEAETTELNGQLQADGGTPPEAARRFVRARAQELGLDADDLSATLPPDRQSPRLTPVLWDAAEKKYRFTRVSFGQARQGIPVFGARVDVLVRNDPDSSIVHVTSDALPLGAFRPQLRDISVSEQKIKDYVLRHAKRLNLAGQARTSAASGLDDFETVAPVIWAGTRETPEAPRLAGTLVARSTTGGHRFRLVVDAETGDVLQAENLVVFETVSGEVSGHATLGDGAMECEPTAQTAMPNARLFMGETEISADTTGSFSFDAPGGEAFDLISSVAGTYFTVQGPRGGNERLTETATPPATVAFVHNEGLTEGTLAQVNGYVQATQVRDWLLDFHPDFPVIASQVNFPVNVNLTTDYCPGNAWYDGASLNFCRSSADYANTSFASVNHHEYGHHIVDSAGSGQGAYGEGMADVIAMLIADDPGLGYGFFRNQCDEPLRTADNDCQFSKRACSSCGSEVHECGNLISGIVWDIRQALAETEGENALALLSNLVVNSTLLHSGTAINRRIAVHLLTLDDDDGDVGNGTPHREEICSGFEAHGIHCPPLDLGIKIQQQARFDFSGDPGGPFVPNQITATVTNRGPGSAAFTAESSVDWLVVSPARGTLGEGEEALVEVSIDSTAASSLAQGSYEATVTFVDGSGQNSDVVRRVRLQIGAPVLKYSFTFDEDPGWTTNGLWQFGQPQGQGGDPAAGASGNNVYGYNLAGAYRADRPERQLTTTSIDCSGLSETTLRFQRWLGIESNDFDHASVRISANGIDWTTVWENGQETIEESEWSLQAIDISEIADGEANVFIQWTLGPTDSSLEMAGWNIDDVEIWGFQE